jgi:YD repeat-containing protein
MRARQLAAAVVCSSVGACEVLDTAPCWAATQYTYDQLGRIQSATYDNGQQVFYSYDAAGNRTSVTTQAGNNLGPVANPDQETAYQNSFVTFDPTANDTSPQGFPLSVTAVGGASHLAPSHGSVSNTGNSVTYTPTPNSGYTGPDTFTYTVSDNHGRSVYAYVFVNVAVVTPPIANADSIRMAQNAFVNFDPRANDVEPNPLYSLTITAVSTPAYGTAVVNNNGQSVTYTPANGFIGNDSFTYTISDGHGGTAIGTVTAAVGSPPVAVADIAGTAANTAVTFDPRINDTDPNGFVINVQSAGTPSSGTSGVNNNMTLTYTPNAGHTGLDTFSYTISDSHFTSTATESVCTGIQPPVASPVTSQGLNNVPYQGTTYATSKVAPLPSATVSCNLNASAIVYSVGAASKGTSSTDGNYVYWVSSQPLGEGVYTNYDSFPYTITDPYGQTASGTVTVNFTILCTGPNCQQ